MPRSEALRDGDEQGMQLGRRAAIEGPRAVPRLALLDAVAADRRADIRLDQAARRAFVAGRELPLTTQLFDLLAYFLEHRGEAISFDALASEVWAYPNGGTDHHFLHTAVYRLRRILHAEGIDDLIDGIRGYGYRISGAPTAAPGAVDSPQATEAAGAGASPRGVAIFDPLDPDLRLSMANEDAVKVTGYPVAALTNLPGIARQLWSPEERAIIAATVAEALEAGKAETRGRGLLRADGSTVRVNVSFTRLDMPDGPPLCLAEVVRDDVAGEVDGDGTQQRPTSLTG